MSRIDEITQKMMEEFEIHKIEDTPENRISFLTGVRDAWREDTSSSLEKTLYMFTITGMINIEKIKLIGKK